MDSRNIAKKFKIKKEFINKVKNISNKQPQYIQLQFDFMKDFENSETCQMKN